MDIAVGLVKDIDVDFVLGSGKYEDFKLLDTDEARQLHDFLDFQHDEDGDFSPPSCLRCAHNDHSINVEVENLYCRPHRHRGQETFSNIHLGQHTEAHCW